jgi:hypothetical protein
MPRRIDIELTSARDDGTWTWRAAGAREPKGTVASTVLPDQAKVGDVLKVDAEFFVDGIEITAVIPTGRERKEPTRLELLSRGSDEPLVTSTLAPRRDDRGPRRGRGPRREAEGRDRDRPRRDRRDGEDRGRARRDDRPPRRERPAPPPMPAVERPKAKRLRAAKAHRSALLDSLPEEQRPVAEQLVLGGLPAVRQAIDKQNAERKAASEPPIAPQPLVDMAEKLIPKVRAAEWRDRAEAARRDLEVIDLRDLRSVVSASGDAGKDPEARTLADELKAGLAARVDAEHTLWLEELTATVEVGRVVRALRLSSRPPKAGAPLPSELAARLTATASEALTADASSERWIAVLDALAFSPVRDKVIPTSLPAELHADVRATIARLATRIPKVAHIFEIEPDPTAPRPKVERRRPAKKKPAATDRPGGRRERGPGATAAVERSTEAKDEASEAPATGSPVTDAQAAAEREPAPVVAEASAPDEPTTEPEVDATPATAEQEPAPADEVDAAEATAEQEPAPADEATPPPPQSEATTEPVADGPDASS